MKRRTPTKVTVSLNLGFIEMSGEWEPNDVERAAAWELYVELVTRVTTVRLDNGEGLLREALTSLYSVFSTTRQILRASGPDIANPKPDSQYNFAVLAVSVLNFALRPLLTTWHPRLADWEDVRPPGTSRQAHENAWADAPHLRQELERTRAMLADYAQTLSDACGVPNLIGKLPGDAST